MSTFWRHFYLRHIALLLVTGLGLMALFHYSTLDLYLADPWYDPGQGI